MVYRMFTLDPGARQTYSDCFKLMVQKVADLDAVDANNETVLHIAARSGIDILAKVLLTDKCQRS
jgi:hypothetical protein